VIETLSDYLASKKLLLVLDNAEHLLEGCVQFVDLILRHSPDVAMLVTSRERLGMTGELTYRVPSLTVPGTNETLTPETVSRYEGVRLFVERAKLMRHDFDLTAKNASCVASICARLDGMPLAIELAAPRLRSMSVDELNGRLDQRFALLTDGSRAALARHRTLRSTIDWSYDLLREPEKLFLQRLSVFAGGWTLAAAEAVCAGEGIEHRDVLDLLTSLADKSLVVPEQEDAQTRWRLLETVRQYARDRLEDSGGSAAARVRHRDYYLALAEEADPKLRGAEEAEWLRRLEDEHENLRAGLEWSLVEAGSKGGLRLCGALQRFWWTHGHLAEGRQWCTRVLCKAGAEERTRERANVLNAAGVLAYHQGDYPAARALLGESLAIRRELGDQFGIPASLEGLAAVVASQRDSMRAARIWGATERSRAEIGAPLPPSERSGYDRYVAAARIASGDDAAFDSAWQEGRCLTLDQAMDLALARPVEGG